MMLEGSWVLGYNDDKQLRFINKPPLIYYIIGWRQTWQSGVSFLAYRAKQEKLEVESVVEVSAHVASDPASWDEPAFPVCSSSPP